VFNCNSISAVFKPNNVISFGGRDLTMDQIAAALSGSPRLTLELPLMDQTGLEGGLISRPNSRESLRLTIQRHIWMLFKTSLD
jgi:hypothetical protein